VRKEARTDFARKLRSNMTDAEHRLWFHLRKRQLADLRFRRQHPIAGYIADFACLEARLVIELDGSQHLDSSSDAVREAAIRQAGFQILRFWNDDVLLRTQRVLEAILKTALEGGR
jgi:very-short-patch-repair endonuclease